MSRLRVVLPGAVVEWGRKGADLGYVIAAYAVVIGSVTAYALWVRAQRRALDRGSADSAGRGETASEGDSERS